MVDAKHQPQYELLYHPSIPGRAEFIRLMFEATGTSYTDVANENPPDDSGLHGYAQVQDMSDPDSTGDDDGNPPVFAPPGLRIHGAGKGGKPLVIHQTPNILLYLGGSLKLAGSDEPEKYCVNQLALTALDLNNETHDTHHPVAVAKYYEEQKEEALKKATDFRENRLPKFFSYFERVLKHNQSAGKGKHLVGESLTYADLTLWQVIDGLKFAFPNEMRHRSSESPLLFDTFYPSLKEKAWLKKYLDSKRRKPYSMGVFRHYPELDRHVVLIAGVSKPTSPSQNVWVNIRHAILSTPLRLHRSEPSQSRLLESNHLSDMSEIHRSPKTVQKPKSRRQAWVHRRRQLQTDQENKKQPEQSAENPNTTLGPTAPTISTMAPQTLDGARRRASLQGIGSTLNFLTPPTESKEWSSTQSCPSPAVCDLNDAVTHRPTTPEISKVAHQTDNSETIRVNLQITPRTTFDHDPVPASRIAATSCNNISSTSEHKILTTLSNHDFFIPPNASLNASSLILFKHSTPSLERFRLLHNQLFIELGRVVEEQLQPTMSPEMSAEAYSLKEELMLGLLTEVVPALNHLAERVGKEAKSGIQKHRAGLRLWAGERGQKKEGN
ncbi:glutathione S-transferase [Aureobasidium subglaciale]|nr:glutathione S-transferase [Aureobasidium subglaciale]